MLKGDKGDPGKDGADGKDGKSIHFINEYPIVTPTKNFSVELETLPNAQVDDLVLFVDTTLGIVTHISKTNVSGRVIAILKGKDGVTPDLSNYYTKEETDLFASGLESSFKGLLGDYYTAVQIDHMLGDISNALDVLHAYAQTLKGGEAV